MAKFNSRGFYKAVKTGRHNYNAEQITSLFSRIDENRVRALSSSLKAYLGVNLPQAISRRVGLGAYRTNPYVLVTSASLMDLSQPDDFASFLFNTKLYMGLETSFGKSVEAVFTDHYPINAPRDGAWQDPPEKIAESEALVGLSSEEKAQRRTDSVWREVDKSCVVGSRRYLVSIKSGPNCINDSQVAAMKSAIADNYLNWLNESAACFPEVKELDIVVGITYGTAATTNNKENQILVKLLQHGFKEEDRKRKPGVLIDSKTRRIRVYRYIGQDFWSFIGNPTEPGSADFVYLEALLALAKALSEGGAEASMEDQINAKIGELSVALSKLAFPRGSLPEWIREDFSSSELFWLATAMTAFFDEGI